MSSMSIIQHKFYKFTVQDIITGRTVCEDTRVMTVGERDETTNDESDADSTDEAQPLRQAAIPWWFRSSRRFFDI